MADANTQLATRRGAGKLTLQGKAPAELARIINIENWALSLLRGDPYREPDPEFLSRMLVFQTLTAETIEDIFRQAKIKKLQEMVPDTPGASTGPRELLDLYVAKSDFETGNPCYTILTTMDLELGEEERFHTGATNVQATLLALLDRGVWPIRFQIVRGDNKDKGDRYMFFMTQPD
jgi:hypothetical protein